MTFRILEGYATAREHIARLRSGEETLVPEQLLARLRGIFGREISPQEAVSQIVADVRRGGDAVLRDYTERIDSIHLDQFIVEAEMIKAAYETAPHDLRKALHAAADRIRSFHQREPCYSWLSWESETVVGQRAIPLQRVGVYVPGGTASYPSSLLMSVIPAQVAGVPEIIVTIPPGPPTPSGATGTRGPMMAILAAAHVVGLNQIFLVGGAQAIAALAYGTESVPRVDKIVGAGGLFVTLAKKQVYGDVGIDGLNGPTETLLIADETANPAWVAADLLAQAEHDPLATPLLITPSMELARAVQSQIARQLASQARQVMIEQALQGQGAILVVTDLTQALYLANEYAPEHLCLLVADPWSLIGQVRNAGGVFLGESTSEALGDYIVGPSHIMHTRGTARFASPLHVRDFVKVTSILAVDPVTARQLAPLARILAEAEGLSAHAAAIAARESPAHTSSTCRDEPSDKEKT